MENSRNAIIELGTRNLSQECKEALWKIYSVYAAWAKRKGYKMELMDDSGMKEGEHLCAVARIAGEDAHNCLKGENLIHRLCRIPESDIKKRVHVSHVAMRTYAEPLPEELILADGEIKIEHLIPRNIGGQQAGIPNIAIKAIHLPTGVSAVCRSARSQIHNKDNAISLLKTRLFNRENAQIELTEHRTYREDPFKFVADSKGNRTNDIEAVWEGKIDMFFEENK